VRFFVARLSHETNTFSSIVTDRGQFEAQELRYGGEILEAYRGTATCVGGMIDGAAARGPRSGAERRRARARRHAARPARGARRLRRRTAGDATVARPGRGSRAARRGSGPRRRQAGRGAGRAGEPAFGAAGLPALASRPVPGAVRRRAGGPSSVRGALASPRSCRAAPGW